MQTSEYRHMTKNEKKALAKHPTRAAVKRILAPLTAAVARTKPASDERRTLLMERRELFGTIKRRRATA